MRRLFTILLACWPLLHWCEPAFSQACPVPIPGPMTSPAPVPGAFQGTLPDPGTSCTPPPPTLVNGGCGSANGVASQTVPTSGLCNSGSATTVNLSGDGTQWIWGCLGSGGGTNAMCSAPATIIPPPPPATITFGETSVLSEMDSGSANALTVQTAVLSQDCTLQSISWYVLDAVGQARLGLFTAGDAIVVQTPAFVPVSNAWNTQPVGNVRISAGTYQLAWFVNNQGLSNPITHSGGSGRWFSRPFGVMPATLPTTPTGSASEHWSIYATCVP